VLGRTIRIDRSPIGPTEAKEPVMQAYPTMHAGPTTAAAQQEAAGLFIEDLFARHHEEIYGYLARMLHDPELAADLTQDAFIKAFRAQRTLKDQARAKAWLYQIAHRVALDELRHRRIIRFVPWAGESHGAAPSAEHVLMATLGSGEVQGALDQIPERQRAALLLAELHDLTGLELAAALGVSHGGARALLSRGRKSLRQEMTAERDADGQGGFQSRRADRWAPSPGACTKPGPPTGHSFVVRRSACR
jgi:RNA polymerase sigma-70 factor, ECF subfamily